MNRRTSSTRGPRSGLTIMSSTSDNSPQPPADYTAAQELVHQEHVARGREWEEECDICFDQDMEAQRWADEELAGERLDEDDSEALMAWYAGAGARDDQLLLTAGDPDIADRAEEMSRDEIREVIAGLREELLGIDDRVTAEHPDDQQAQNEAAKAIRRDIESEIRTWQKELDHIERAERWKYRYGLDTPEQNEQVRRAMDIIIQEANVQIANMKTDVAARIRQMMLEAANALGVDLQTQAARERIYNDLVDAGIIQTFEPIDTLY